MKIDSNLLTPENTFALIKLIFRVTLTQKEIEIVNSIAYPDNNRVVISCYTRYGKTYCVSIGILLYVLIHENKSIKIISATDTQASVFRNYISEFIIKSPLLISIVDIVVSGIERLKAEVNKKRITFKNGCDIMMLSAEGAADRLLGWGGDLIVVDESCLISFETYRKKISRMLGDSPDSIMVLIGNPWHKANQMYIFWTDPTVKKIHIDYKTGLKEGRISQTFIDEQKRLLSPMEFRVLYESEFPEDTEDTLIKYEWIQKALNKEIIMDAPEVVHGLDVAEMGNDLTVLTSGLRDGNKYRVTEINSWGKRDTMQTVSLTKGRIQQKTELINIDATGVGKGVQDRLNELGYTSVGIKVGRSAEHERDRFINLKAEIYWRLRALFEDGNISIPEHPELIKQLNLMRYEIDSGGKIKIIDPEKSPDFADSLALMCCMAGGGFIILQDKENIFGLG